MNQPPDHATRHAASGVLIFLIEELGDARLRAEQLQKYVQASLDLVQQSPERDRLYEAAGHLLHGVPDTLFKLSKALDAAALAASKLDYEETKFGLRPEKVDALEAAAEETRLRTIPRRSHEGTPMTPAKLTTTQAAEQLTIIATQTEATGRVPVIRLAALLAALGQPQTKMASSNAAGAFRQIAAHLQAPGKVNRATVVADLRRLYAEALMAEQVEAGAGEDFQKANPAITDEEAKRIDLEHLKNKDKLKHAGVAVSLQDALEDIERDILQTARPISLVSRATTQILDDLLEYGRLKAEAKAFGDAVKDMTDSHEKAEKAVQKLQEKMMEGEGKEARFPAGKPADPTKHMSEEDAKVWQDMNDKYKDVVKEQYKAASDRQAEASEVGLALAQRGIDASYAPRHGHGFWVKDKGWVDMKTARSMLEPVVDAAPVPVTCPGLSWGIE